MQTLKQVVGIDVASKELIVYFGKLFTHLEKQFYLYGNFRNTAQGLEQLYQWVEKHKESDVSLHYIMEATGVYHEKLAYFLESKRCNISIILPNKISNYFRSLEIKTITNRTSSEAITLFGLERNTVLWKSPDPAYKSLKQLTRERDQLVEERTMLKNQLHAKQSESIPNNHSIKRIQYRITILNDQEIEILNEIKEVIKSNPKLTEAVNIIKSIPGIGLLTAAIILAETNGFEMIRNKKQLVSYAGLDIKEKQSGTSINGKPMISKRGNRYLRKPMHLPELTAIKHQQHYKTIFARLVNKHGIKMKAAVAVQRKLLELTLYFSKLNNNTIQNII